MTRKDAAAKIAKLIRLADDPRTQPAEATSARQLASKIQTEYKIGPQDIETDRLCAAFDELVGVVEKIVERHPSLPGLFGTRKIVSDVLGSVRCIGDDDKSARLRQLVGIVRVASFVAGSIPLVAELKAAVDTALANNNVTI
jgi:hypothetical protein